jgi:Cys-tRNA(Pro)/Cys-tRNA(Cys) deacylase
MMYNGFGDNMAQKTNAVRIVEQAGFPCKEAFYEYDEKDLSGMHAAEALGFEPEQVFKTLVARGPKTGIHVFCIPVCCNLDLKKAAAAAGDKSMEMVAVKELLALTGYIRGGCSPLGMKRTYHTVIDETCELFEEIAVSAGQRGHQMILPVEALVQLADAEIKDIIA